MPIIMFRMILFVVVIHIHEASRIMCLYWCQRRSILIGRRGLSLFLLFLLSPLLLQIVSQCSGQNKPDHTYLLIFLILRELLWLILLLLSLLGPLSWRLGKLSLGMHLLYFGKIRVPTKRSLSFSCHGMGCPYMKLLSKTCECSARRGLASLI